MPAHPLPPEKVRRVRESYRRTGSVRRTAHELKLAEWTVRKYAIETPDGAAAEPRKAKKGCGLPAAAHEGVDLPASVAAEWTPYPIDRPGVWLVLSDAHVPYHDRATLELAVGEARKRGAVGVLVNGDLLDSHEISRHDKDPRAPRYVQEVEAGRQFWRWLRDRLPKADLVYKSGNHEERLDAYVMRHAPALFGLEGLDLPSLLHLADVGAEWVTDKRVVTLGKLHVVHGHEYPGGAASPVNPARGLYLKAKYVSMCGHHHRTSEHNDRDIRGKLETAWSVGCACSLHPKYQPINQWNHGYALVELASDGMFQVQNKRVVGGQPV
ncbi:MAG TPA: hypothetical protein VEI97_08170 [bacterium]|nr:hypothetical protein [bacterium]